jgi:hypothetical protein
MTKTKAEYEAPLLHTKDTLKLSIHKERLLTVETDMLCGQYSIATSKAFIANQGGQIILQIVSLGNIIYQTFTLNKNTSKELVTFLRKSKINIGKIDFPIPNLTFNPLSLRTKAKNVNLHIEQEVYSTKLILLSCSTNCNINYGQTGIAVYHVKESIKVEFHFLTEDESYQSMYFEKKHFADLVNYFRALGFRINNPNPNNYK